MKYKQTLCSRSCLCWRDGCNRGHQAAPGGCFTPVIFLLLSCQQLICAVGSAGCRIALLPCGVALCLASNLHVQDMVWSGNSESICSTWQQL